MPDKTNELYVENVPLVTAESANGGKPMTRRALLGTVLKGIGVGTGLAAANKILPLKLFAQDGGGNGFSYEVGKVFAIDGVPDPSYPLKTPGECVYAFLDLMEAFRKDPNNANSLCEMLSNRVYSKFSKPVPSLSHIREVAAEKVRTYPVVGQVQILKINSLEQADPGAYRVRVNIKYANGDPDLECGFTVQRDGVGPFKMAGGYVYTDARFAKEVLDIK